MGQMGRIFPEFTKEAVLVIASTILRFYTFLSASVLILEEVARMRIGK